MSRFSSRSTHPVRVALAAVAATLLWSPAVWAGPGMGGEGCMGRTGAAHERMAERQADRHERHLDRLKQVLQLSPAQEAAWAEYAQAMKPMTSARPTPDSDDSLTAPQRLERQLARHQERHQAMTQRLAALQKFYAVLSPEQQKRFDALHDRGGRRGHDGPMGPGRHG